MTSSAARRAPAPAIPPQRRPRPSERVEQLRAIPLFRDLSRQSLSLVAKLLDDFHAPPGTVLMQAGMPGTGLLLIEQGMVEVELKRRKVRVGAGEFVGELALLDPRAVRTARVVTKTEVYGVIVQRRAFLLMLRSEPKIAITMLSVLARRLADATGD